MRVTHHAGALLLFTHGEYEMFGPACDAVYRVARDLDIVALALAFEAANESHETRVFAQWLVDNGWATAEAYDEVFAGAYGPISRALAGQYGKAPA